MRAKLFVLSTVMILAVVLSACSGAAAAQSLTPTPALSGAVSNPPPRTISVTGSGKTYLSPDIAYINIGVHTEGKDAAKAVADNNTQAKKVTDTLKSMGVDPKDIQTTNFSIYPQQQYDTQGKPTGEITYMVDNTVYVTVRNLDKIGDLLDAVVKAGANQINGIQFDVADRNKALSDARTAAVADANAQAEELAKAAGVTLGAVQTINTATTSVPLPVAVGKGAAAAEVAPSVPVNPGQMVVTVDVNLVYEIK